MSYYIDEYLIEVTDEKGFTSVMHTGISKLYKQKVLDEIFEYIRECNPTKQFTLLIE